MRTEKVPAPMHLHERIREISSSLRGGRLTLVPSCGDVRRVAVRACVWSGVRQVQMFSPLEGSAGRDRRANGLPCGQTGGFPLLRSAQSGETHLASRPSPRLTRPLHSGCGLGSACATVHLATPDGLPGVHPVSTWFWAPVRRAGVNKRYQTPACAASWCPGALGGTGTS